VQMDVETLHKSRFARAWKSKGQGGTYRPCRRRQ
jgi:hypothetical protein